MSKTNLLFVFLGLIVFVVLGLPLHGWIIDDAGISFAYAKNIAGWHGMVSQPGVEPVEGISNPLWTWLFVPLFWLGWFSELWSTKILSIACIGVCLWFLLRISDQLTDRSVWAKALVVFATVCSAPIIIWCSSGLENPLYIALVIALLWITVRRDGAALSKIGRDSFIAGILAALTALTRPEGIVYSSLFPVYLLVSYLLDRSISIVDSLKGIGRYVIALGFILGGYLLFRWLYFNDIYPNTYYVKGGPSAEMALDVLWLGGKFGTKLEGILESFIGFKARFIAPIGVIACASMALSHKRHRAGILTVAFSVALAVYTYLLMTNDWMGEFRFASPVYPLMFLTLALCFNQMMSLLIRSSKAQWAVAAMLTVSLTGAVWFANSRRMAIFSSRPPTDYFYMSRLYGLKFNAYADYLKLDTASFLVPDFGGTLMHSRLRLYDFAGLCDRTIPQTREINQKAFYDYVFETIRPTFIHTHGFFTRVSKLDDDPRFRRDYLPIFETIDSYTKRHSLNNVSGDFVRRDAVLGREYLVDSLVPLIGTRPEYQ